MFSGILPLCMRKFKTEGLLPFDSEIERTCRRNQKEKWGTFSTNSPTMKNLINNGRNNENERNNEAFRGAVPTTRALRDYALPTVNKNLSGVRRLTVQANNFEIKSTIIQMVQNSQFCGLANEDPNAHIANFLEICDTFKSNGVTDDAIYQGYFRFLFGIKLKFGWICFLQDQSRLGQSWHKFFFQNSFPLPKLSSWGMVLLPLASMIWSHCMKHGRDIKICWGGAPIMVYQIGCKFRLFTMGWVVQLVH